MKNSEAAVVMDELVILGIVIIMFSSTIAFTINMSNQIEKDNQGNELQKSALETLKTIRNHHELIYKNEPGLFDHRKLLELTNMSLLYLVNIPHGHGLCIKIYDVRAMQRFDRIILSYAPGDPTCSAALENAVVSRPVNVRLNQYETHPAFMEVKLWRSGDFYERS